ncbi:hypothetical protein GJ496_009475 [Pomphorhynchus laevis]|nr:hypothetical protein GJ496_009475 [Pomphorhynchus laevis]
MIWFFICSICFGISQVVSDCVMYDEMYLDIRAPIPYSGVAKPINDNETISKLKRVCPHLFIESNVENEFCCNSRQIESLRSNLAMLSGIIGRCPACFTNLQQLLCHITCSKDQSLFMKVNEIKTIDFSKYDADIDTTNLPSRYIYNFTVEFSSEYGNNLFDSCKDVSYPMNNQPAMEMLCGLKYGCNANKLFKFMGTKGSTDFVTNFVMIDRNDTYFPSNGIRSWHCWQSPYNGIEVLNPCSCSDCQAVCDMEDSIDGVVHRGKGAPFSEHLNTKKVAGMDLAHFTVLVAFLIFLLLFFLAELWHNDESITEEMLTDEEIQKLSFENHINNSDVEFRIASGKISKRYPFANFNTMVNKLGFQLQQTISIFMARMGRLCALYPYFIISLSIAIIASLSCGIIFYDVTTDPIELWSSPHSKHRQAKDVFDTNFGPFYRITQIILKPNFKSTDNIPAVFSKEMIEFTLNLTAQLSTLSFDHIVNESYISQVNLSQICLKPMEPENSNCLIHSISEYFQTDLRNFWIQSPGLSNDQPLQPRQYNHLSHIKECINSPMNMRVMHSNLSCMSSSGMPIEPYMILGGFDSFDVKDPTEMNQMYLRTSKTLVITLIGKNGLKNDSLLPLAMSWEKGVIEWLDDFSKSQNICQITYRAERSIEDEIERESHSDILTISLSYTIMFLYISIALSFAGQNTGNSNMSTTGFVGRLRTFLIKLKLTMAMVGVLSAILSVIASVGFFSYLHFPTSLIVFEVVPFLVLAVGVDNIFLLTKSLQNVQNCDNLSIHTKTIPNQLADALSHTGPSILLTGSAECIAFLMGTMTTVPAVKMFSFYASMALFIDIVLQLTAFVSLMSLDCKRQQSNRMDLLCCIKMSKSKNEDTSLVLNHTNDHRFIKYYSRFLLKRKIRPFVILIFSTWVFSSIMIITKLPIGLDPKLTVPQNSYVLKFMDDMQAYLRVGPPVYFILKSKNKLNVKSNVFRRAICGRSGCDSDSLINQISWAAHRSNLSRIAYSPSSWLDDYEQWTHHQSECCFLNKTNDEFCSASYSQFRNECYSCPNAPFDRYLRNFLKDNPGKHCPLSGRAAYKNAIVFNNRNEVTSSYFMTYHTLLVTSQDFIAALKSAEWLAANITLSLHNKGFTDAHVIPYSVFYVFYEQYLDIWNTILINVSFSVLAIFLVSFILLGFDLTSSVIIVTSIAMITVNIGGLMYLWDIELNAISLVNVVMSLGISVEFCAHLVREFSLINYGTRRQRARIALANVGEAVFSGITLTKIGGIIVLAFSHSQLFQVFYFRMYLCIIFCGALHGLVFLPVLLSYAGGPIRWTFKDNVVKSSSNSNNVDKVSSIDSTNESLLQNQYENPNDKHEE